MPDRASPAVGAKAAGEAQASSGLRLRLARLSSGLSQEQLAAKANVSRQAVAGIEAGRFDPSLRVALDLARALGRSVEELFAALPAEAPRTAVLLEAPLGLLAGQRVELAQVGNVEVALPLVGDHALVPGFQPAFGQVVGAPGATKAAFGQSVLVEAGPPGHGAVVVAGCDPALALLSGVLSSLEPPRRLAWWHCNSATALDLAAAGLVHAAGVHLPEGDAGLEALAARAGARAEVLGFGAWDEGLALGPSVGKGVFGISELAERRLRLVNREQGSEARQLLDDELAKEGIGASELPGYDSAVRAHLLVASAIAAGLGEAGVTMEPAARVFGLGFVPLAREAFRLVVPRALLETPETKALLQALSAPALRLELGRLPGYDPTTCGEAVASL
jgi:putative molybdopterin biosynthesis protein